MSVQVGGSCYATQADAVPALCARFEPQYSLAGNQSTSLVCDGPGTSAGTILLMRTVIADITNAVPSITVTHYSMPVSAPPCVETDYINALEAIAGPVLGLWALWYGGKKVLDLLRWHRGGADA